MTEWQMGMRAFQEGRLREAVDRLRSASLEHDRTISQSVAFQIYAFLGAALYALGQPSEAVEAFVQAIHLRLSHKPPFDLMLNLANAYLAAGQQEAAESALADALQEYPGAMEARTLLERLHLRTGTEPITGAIFGETPESVKTFLNTLTFSTISRGYAPDQVTAAMTQIEKYVDFLAGLLDEQEQTVALYVSENARLRRSEETLVENLLQLRQEADQARQTGLTTDTQANGTPSDVSSDITPLQRLFQQKNA